MRWWHIVLLSLGIILLVGGISILLLLDNPQYAPSSITSQSVEGKSTYTLPTYTPSEQQQPIWTPPKSSLGLDMDEVRRWAEKSEQLKKEQELDELNRQREQELQELQVQQRQQELEIVEQQWQQEQLERQLAQEREQLREHYLDLAQAYYAMADMERQRAGELERISLSALTDWERADVSYAIIDCYHRAEEYESQATYYLLLSGY